MTSTNPTTANTTIGPPSNTNSRSANITTHPITDPHHHTHNNQPTPKPMTLGRFAMEPERIALLHLPAHTDAQLRMAIRLFQQHARIIIRLEDPGPDAVQHRTARFGVVQTIPTLDGRTFSPAELADRAENALEPLIQAGWHVQVCVGKAAGFWME